VNDNELKSSLLRLCHAWHRSPFLVRTRTRLFSSSWNEDMQLFSEYATHVQVGDKDKLVTAVGAISKSMGLSNDSATKIFKQVQPLNPHQLLQLVLSTCR
jgi:hypothetical protein